MTNIIEFPKIKNEESPSVSDAGEARATIKAFKEEYSEEISEFVWRMVISELVRSGCNFKDMEKYFPAMVLVLESIRSLHLLTQKLHHPLQDFAEDSLDMEEFSKKMVDIDEEID